MIGTETLAKETLEVKLKIESVKVNVGVEPSSTPILMRSRFF